MNDSDQKILSETYSKVKQNEETLNEAGLGTQLKARGAGLLGSVGQYAGNIGRSITGKASPVSAGSQYNNAKIDSVLRSHTKDVNNVSNAIVNDLNKLNLNPNKLTPDVIQKDMLGSIYDNLVAQKTGGVSTPTTGATQTPSAKPSTPAPVTSQPKRPVSTTTNPIVLNTPAGSPDSSFTPPADYKPNIPTSPTPAAGTATGTKPEPKEAFPSANNVEPNNMPSAAKETPTASAPKVDAKAETKTEPAATEEKREIPDNSEIDGKDPDTKQPVKFVYSDGKWFEKKLSTAKDAKPGTYQTALYPIEDDTEDLQKLISDAWLKKNPVKKARSNPIFDSKQYPPILEHWYNIINNY